MEKRQNILTIVLVLVLVFGFIGFLAYKGSQNSSQTKSPIIGSLQTTILKNSDSKPQIQVVVEANSATMTMDATTSSGAVTQNNQTTFSDVYPNTDAVYKKVSNGIKEDIVLNQKPTVQPVYNFSIQTDGLTIQYFEGQYYFFDKDGVAKLMVPKPFMVDANGIKSEAVSISITKSGKGYKSTVVPDFNWLSSPERKYPVKIDPSVVVPDRSLREMQDLRTISAKTYSLGGKKYASTSGLEAIHYQDENGKWQEISTAIVPSNDPEYDFMNVTNNFQVFFSTDGFGNKKAVKFQVGDSWMKFNLVGGLGSGEVNTTEGNVFNFNEVYKDGTKTMDAKYTLSDTKLLEEIVLDQFQGYPELKQEIELHNAYLKESGGAINAYRKDTNELLWIIPVPVMYEVNDTTVRNYGLHYEIETLIENTVILTKVIDQEGKDWLSNPARNYPLVIDTTAGPNSPGTMADDSAVGTAAWNFPDNAKTSNSVYSISSTPSSTVNAYSHYLKSTNYGFSIPNDATVDGIEAAIEVKGSYYDGVRFARPEAIKIVKSDGSIGTTNVYGLEQYAFTTSDTYYTYGSYNNLWGETWTPADINDIDFGVVLEVFMQGNGSMNISTFTDHFIVTIYYTVSNIALQGANSPGTLVSDTSAGVLAWSSIGSAASSDNFYTSAVGHSATPQYTHYIKASNFGFTIPVGANIEGIVVQIEAKASDHGGEIMSSSVRDMYVYIVKPDGSIGTSNRANGTVYWEVTDSSYSHGTSSDLWGESWTPEDINDPDFGVVLSARIIEYFMCVSPSTKVETMSGEKRIDEVNIGDKVLSYNEELAELTYDEVINVGSAPISNNGYFRIYYDGGKTIEATGNHKFYTSGSYVKTQDLKVGDKLLSKDLLERSIEKIETIESIADPVWDITVEDDHNFFANGVLVHNTTAYVDQVRIIVYYTKEDGEPGSATSTTRFNNVKINKIKVSQ